SISHAGRAALPVCGRRVDEVLLTGSAALPAWLMDRLPRRTAAARLGVRLQGVSVAALAPPEEVRRSFELVNEAQAGIGTRLNQAKQEANQRLRQADALRYRLGQEAEEYCDTQLRQARADATEFDAALQAYRELKKTNPDALA